MNDRMTVPTGERSKRGRALLRRGKPVRDVSGVDQAGQTFDDDDYLHPLNRGCLGQAVMLALVIIGAVAWSIR